jgi:amino acid adenylation domain-containing protein
LTQRAFETAVVLLDEERCAWYLNVSHLLSDGWSYGLLYRQLGEHYQRLLESGHVQEQSSAPFLDVLEAQQKRRQGPAAERSRNYFDERRPPQLSALEILGTQPDQRSDQEARFTCRLGPERTRRLRDRARQVQQTTLTESLAVLNILATNLAALLHRTTGTRDLAVSVPIHLRSSEVERTTFGLLQETLPLYLSLEEGDPFSALQQRVSREVFQALRHARFGVCAPEHPEAFEVILNYVPVTFPAFAGQRPTVRWVHSGSGDGHRLLFLHVHDFEDCGDLVLHFDCNQGVFGEPVRRRLAQCFLQLLDSYLDDPEQEIALARLLCDDERRQLRTFNATGMELPEASLTERFEAQVGRTPSAPAIDLGATSWTYVDLNARANRLAQELIDSGVEPGQHVAVCADRQVETLVAILATWKAGATYVPLDPSYPGERLSFLLQDSAASAILTRREHLQLLGEGAAPRIVVDESAPLTEADLQRPDSAPRSGLQDPAYVIYTSGSTGKPKGVVLSQRVLANLVHWQVHHGSQLQRPRTLQYTPLTFDVSLQEILSTWYSGGTLVLIDAATRRDPEATLRHIQAKKVEQLFIIYTPLQQLAEAAARSNLLPTSLRKVITAGEQVQITPALVQLFESLPDCRFFNQYGPSETHIVTAEPLTDPPSAWPTLPSIGRPVANTEAYILDRRGQPLPIGVAGELYFGGFQVADEYWRRAELTAERFLPDPHRGEPYRWYKTGDRARFEEDGSIQFLGRLDHQVKLRGYRIELGEVEAALRQYPAVREAAAAVHAQPKSGKLLVGYYVLDPNLGSERPASLASALRAFLLDKLPEPMVPSALMELASIPHTLNGKVDRKSLPEPSSQRPDLEQDFLPPQTAAEQKVASIWSELLQLDRVGRRDNFFSLGGHSLLLVDLHTKLRDEFDSDLAIVDLFQYPTVETQADFLTQPRRAAESRQVQKQAQLRAARQRQALRQRHRMGPVER